MKKTAISGLTLLVAIALLVWWFDWNMLRGFVERRVAARTGREASIGHLGVKLGWVPVIRLDAVRLGNIDGSKEPNFLTADALTLSVRLRDLLHGRVVLPEVTLEKPRLVLERRLDGTSNWSFAKPAGDKPSSPPRIERLFVRQGTVSVSDAVTKTEIAATVDTVSEQQASFRATGTYRGNAFEASGRGGGLLSLTDTGTPYPLAIDARAGRTKAGFDGSVTGIATLKALDGAFTLAGADLGDLYALLNVALPPSPAYQVRGRLKRSEKLWQLGAMSGRIGSSDMAGSLEFDQSKPKPLLRADLASKSLDLVDLGGFIGAETKPARGPRGDAASLKPAPVGEKLFPNKPFNFEKLNAMNADVKLVARQIKRRAGLPLDNLSTHLQLEDGHLQLKPLSFGVAGGEIRSALGIDVRKPPMVFDGDIEVRRLQLNRLMPEVKIMQSATGYVGGSAKLHGRGNSFAQLLGTADGQAGVAMSGGQVSRLLVDLGGLDLGGALLGTLKSKKTIDIRCAAAAFKVESGVMKAETLVLDTSDTNFAGTGTISLKEETLDVLLRPQPKDMTIGVLRTPLRISGAFKQPKIRPEAGPLATRLGAAALLGAINPIAALLAFIETAPGKNADCDALAGRVQGVKQSGVSSVRRSAARDAAQGRGVKTLPALPAR